MPNWVYNSMSVSGKPEDLLAFAEKAKRPHQTEWLSEGWIRNEDGTNTKVDDKDRKIEVKTETPDAISFWNFLAPTEEEIPYYFGNKVKPEGEADPNATQEERMAKAMSFSGSGWYDWNVRNWGCKWDAGSDELDTDLDEVKAGKETSLTYRFETPWSPAEGAYRAMVEQHPELSFEFHCEEEQGWGVVFEGEAGVLSISKEWDIPQSHADYVALDREGSCSCQHYEDEDDWYDDCPDKSKSHRVSITYTYVVRSQDEERAIAKVKASLTEPKLLTDDPEEIHFAEDSVVATLND
jgi:hypothetical protein